jgi:hypothetical protein
VEQSESPENNNNNETTHSFEQLATVLAKLGRREEARDLLLAAGDSSIAAVFQNPGYVSYQGASERSRLARRLTKLGFPLEAIGLYERSLASPPHRSVWGGNLPQWAHNQREEEREPLREVLATRLDEALAALESELGITSPPNLLTFFALADRPWSEAERSKFADIARGPRSEWSQLLPALLARAREKKTLDTLAERVASARKRYPDDDRLEALATLTGIAQGNIEAARSGLKARTAAVERTQELGIRPETWLLVYESLARKETRELGRGLLSAAFAAASRRGDEDRRAALLDTSGSPEDLDRIRSELPHELKKAQDWHKTRDSQKTPVPPEIESGFIEEGFGDLSP